MSDTPVDTQKRILSLEAQVELAVGFRAALYKLLVEGIGPGGGYYREDQRLVAAVALLKVGWGKV